MSYLISTGWWCSQEDVRRKKVGDDVIRTAQFHKLWHQSIDRFTNPEQILMIDSASPIKPELAADSRLKFLSLAVNGRHATDCLNKYAGWTRAVLLGMHYALMNEFEYYVYVEQDALLYGEGIIEHAISSMSRPIMFGHGKGTPQPTQQSFFIVRHDAIEKVISNYFSIPHTDRRMSPERKLTYALSSYVPKFRLPPRLFFRILRRLGWHNPFAQYGLLPFGYGRQRPISFEDRFFYFQHASQAELDQYLRKTGFTWP